MGTTTQWEERSSPAKLSELIFHPLRFFAQNTDGEIELQRFAVFIVRVSLAIEAIGLLFVINFTAQGFLVFVSLIAAVWFFTAPIAAWIIKEFGRAVNFLTKILGGKDDPIKGKRVSVYNTPFIALLLHSYLILVVSGSLAVLGIFVVFVVFLSFLWQTIGIAKQYQFSWQRAFFISFSPFVLFFLAMILILGWPAFMLGCDGNISEVLSTGGKCFF